MKKIFFIIASALFIAACTSQTEELVTPIPENQEPEGQKVTLCATIASDDGAANAPQRVSGKDSDPGSTTGVINLTWDEGDEVLIKVGEESAVFTLSGGAGTNVGSFTGVMPGDGSSYDVVYPADYNEDVLTEQTYVENGFGRDLMKMSTKTPGTVEGGFTLSADNALLGLQLAGNDELGKIVLTNPADSKTYTLNCSDATLEPTTATLFYIVVPAAEWTDGFTVDVYNSESTLLKTYTKSSTAEFAAGKAMMMPAKALGLFFSVGADKKVEFSKGNLQYHPKNKKWRFAESQLDYIGAANNEENFENAEYDGWLDLFGWSSTKSKYGMNKNEFFGKFGDFVDWGQNQIGTDAANTWRTLSLEEWEYLVETRSNADQLYGVAQVAGVNGLILLPDIWICPSGISFKFGNHNADGVEYYAAHQSFTAEEWAKLEDAGAIFLPAAGERFHEWGSNWTIWQVQKNGYYWSNTLKSDDGSNPMSHVLSFTSQTARTSYWECYSGLSVRLVKDLE